MRPWSTIRTRHLRYVATMVLALGLSATMTSAATRYHLRVHAAPTFIQRFVFALTCSDSLNALTIYDAEHDGDGIGIVTSTEGGPAMGHLLFGLNPADTTTLIGGTFYSDMNLQLQNITYFNCDLDLTEHAPDDTIATSQFALYWLNDDEAVRLSDDPLGANALAVLDITGASGGELSVFYPMTFVAPDTLLLHGELADVPTEPEPERIRFSSIVPNPVRGGVLFSFDLPAHGHVELRVYDVAGRLVATPLRGAREAGAVNVSWSRLGRSGSKVPPGVYLAEIRFGPQSAVRRFVVAP
jgi:FlgD Ig-like domain